MLKNDRSTRDAATSDRATRNRATGNNAKPSGPQLPSLTLTKNLANAVLSGHPWVYRDSVRANGTWPEEGATCDLLDRDGRFLARGLYAVGPIAFRALSRKREAIDRGFVVRRVRAAHQLRQRLLDDDIDAYRLLFGENDGLPGIIVDVYATIAVIKLDGGFAASLLPALQDALLECRTKDGTPFTALIVREGRGESKTSRALFGELPSGPFVVREYGMKLWVDVLLGQKTGMFLDHRESRKIVRKLSRGLDVLNLYGYTGAFSVAAALGGAKSVETVDVAKDALLFAQKSIDENGLTTQHFTSAMDVPEFLENARAQTRRWDLIVADPPSFAPNEAARSNTIASYRKLHRSCLSLVREGGFYLAASCSSHLDREAFLRTIEEGAEKAGVGLRRLGLWAAAPDHPVRLPFTESDYLKSFLFQVDKR